MLGTCPCPAVRLVESVLVLELERLLQALSALGGPFLLFQDAGFLKKAPAMNLGQYTVLLNLLCKALQRALKGLVSVHDDPRHMFPPPLTS